MMKKVSKTLRWFLAVCAAALLALAVVACNDGGGSAGSGVTFSGAENYDVKAGASVDWTEGVTAKSSDGKTLEVTADASGVDMQKPGTYTVVLRAGNAYIERLVRVYSMPVIYYAGEAIENGDTFVMTHAELSGASGFSSGMTATDSFGISLDIGVQAPEYTGGAGPYQVTWSAEDAAGNVCSISGSVTLDSAKFPTAQNTEYDLSDEYAEIPVTLAGGERVFLYEGENKINISYYELTESSVLLSGAYLSQGELGTRSLSLETEFGTCAFTISVTDTEPINLDGCDSMDGYMFLQGEPVSIPLAERFGSGYQEIEVEYTSDDGITLRETAGMLEAGTPAAGEYTVTVTASKTSGGDPVSRDISFKVCNEADYYANYGPGTADQFTDRFFVDANSQVTFGFEYLDKDVYGVGSAYRYTASGTFAAWNHRLELLRTTTMFDASAYDTLEFDLCVNGGNATFPFAIFAGASVEYQNFSVYDPQTGTPVDKSALETGKWYHFSANVPLDVPSNGSVYVVLAADNETTDCYIRNISFCNRDFVAVNGSKAILAETEETVSGRSGVTKYVSTAGAWDSRIQFSRATLEQWNAYAEAEENYALTMEVYFTGSLTSLYLRPIEVSGVEAFYTSDQKYVKIYDPNGAAVASPAAGVWYTIEIDIGALGVLGYSAASNDVGLQIAANASNATFYIGSVGFQEARPAPEPLQWVPDYFVSMSGSGGSITYAAEGGGRTDVYKYTSAKSAWESRVQFTQAALARYNELRTAAGGKLVFDVYLESPLGSIQFWAPGGKANTAAFTSGDTAYVTIKAEDGEVAGEIASGVWYTVEIDIAALGELTSGGVDCGLQMAANSDSGGTFYIDSIRFEAAA